jgi:hypothetical protein
MRALRTFTDEEEETRKNGEEWLITSKDTEAHIPNVYEEVRTTFIKLGLSLDSFTENSRGL